MKILVTAKQTFTLEVEPSDTIEEVKKKIDQKEGIPLNQLRLLFAGKRLKNDKTIRYYDIRQDSILHWRLTLGGSMEIIIRTLNDEHFALELEPLDIIENVKNEILEKKNISPNQIRLFYEEKQLENRDILNDYNIGKGSVLFMLPRAIRNIRIDINILGGKILSLEVKTSDNVGYIKNKILNNIGVSTDQIKLLFEEKVLLDDKTLVDYDVENGSLLHLKLRSQFSVQIFIEIPNDKTFLLEVEQIDTIENVKAKIQDMEGILTVQMNLFFNKKLLEDGKSLRSYNITEGCTLQLALRSKRTIQIAVTGKNFHLDVEPCETIDNVKRKICDKGGISVDQIRLISAGEQLMHDDKNLDYYNIREETPISWYYVPRGSILIFVKNSFKKILTLNVKPMDTIENVKEKIQKIEGFPTKALRIIFDGRQLDDDKTVSDYDIKDECTLCYITILKRSTLDLFQF